MAIWQLFNRALSAMHMEYFAVLFSSKQRGTGYNMRVDCAGAHPGRSDGAHTNCSILSLEDSLKSLTKAPNFRLISRFGVDGRCSEQTLGVGEGERRRLPDQERERDFCHRELNNNDPLQPLFPLDLFPDLSLWGSVCVSCGFFYTFCIYS